MPLTVFQKEVLRVLAAHRNPDSHIAGGTAINRSDDSPRYSKDFDVFHDAEESVSLCAEADFLALQKENFSIEWQLRNPTHYRALVGRENDSLKLEWTHDSAFRFFPVQKDDTFGYCLHPADLAANKILAIAFRSEIRAFIDILYLDTNYLSLGAVVWAACGKDQGYSPPFLLNQANRHARFRKEDLESEQLAGQISLQELKQRWLAAVERAENLFQNLDAQEVGCLYLDGNNPVTPVPGDSETSKLIRHFGSVRGAWPKVT